PGNAPELYDLMAISGYGFSRGEVNQEFFNHCINRADINIGDLIANSMEYYGKTSELRYGPEDITYHTDMGAIWASNANCDYDSSWPGGRGSGNGDGDYDWLCYNICFSNDNYYKTLRTLVEGHPTTKQQMEDWLTRYYIRTLNVSIPSGSSTTELGTWGIGGCHLNLVPSTASWDCDGHTDISNTFVTVKPVGARTITLTTHGNTYQQMYGSSLSYTIRTPNGVVIASGSAPKGYWTSTATINVPTKYIWSTLRIEARGVVEQGHKGHNSGGGCISSAMADYLHSNAPGLFPEPAKYHRLTATYTYMNPSNCQRNGHAHAPADYIFNEDHSKCICTMTCPNCGSSYQVASTSVTKTEYADKYVYTAQFVTSNIPAKSTTVLKGSGSQTFSGYSLSGSTSGIAAGTCSLPAGNINPGPKSIIVSVNATDATVKLINKYGQVVDSRSLTTGGPTMGSLVATFDLSSFSDRELEGLYVTCSMQTIVKNFNSTGNYIGNAYGPYSVNHVQINY
nr:hypothetical protein [Pseudobutyrivibrio sp.]